MFSAFVR